MQSFTSYHTADPFPCSQDFYSSSSSSENGNNIIHSNEEVINNLASNHPKKRAGRKKFRETRHPVYRGVRRRDSGKWVCEVREPNKKSRIWLGTFSTVEMAARAHDVATIALRGRSACLNFADSAWRLPIPASSDAKDIKKAAGEAAEAFRTRAPESGEGTATSSVEYPENVFTTTDACVESPEKALFMYDEEEALMFGMHGLLGFSPGPPITGLSAMCGSKSRDVPELVRVCSLFILLAPKGAYYHGTYNTKLLHPPSKILQHLAAPPRIRTPHPGGVSPAVHLLYQLSCALGGIKDLIILINKGS
ncbi:hypothetical protein RD792_005328 [Penstemon davidsonii]|uniref:AP2/ERF domain-containing protein n=1 Tax=Penstemon davidsonii TaxID=160366 RepID=A0ABR0DJU0_9LAMI|nr:hypothetical protein RD792_005328 [Penstemon davidsonii]